MNTDNRPILSFDTETFPISQTNGMHPRIVCLSLAQAGQTDLIGNNDWEALHQTVAGILADTGTLKVGQNLGYDLGVFASNFPDLLPAIFAALDAESFSDTMIREKLLTLAETGDLEYLRMPDGSKTKIRWGLEHLVSRYFGLDIKVEKTDPGAWRLNFNLLDGKPAAEYPPEARNYAINDSTYLIGDGSTEGIWQLQEARRKKLITDRNIDPFATEGFRVMVDFCLKLMSAEGAKTDPEAIAKVEAMLAEELKPEKMNLLTEYGILRPATPPQPFKNGAQDHVEGCPNAVKKTKTPCQCPAKMSEGKPESVCKEKLTEFVLELAKARNTTTCPNCAGEGNVARPENGRNSYIACVTCKASGRVPKAGVELEVKLKYTDPSDRFPLGQLSVDAEFLGDHAHLDATLTQYKHRQDLQKLVTTEIPRMKLNGVVAERVYPQYDSVKETGRTSSFSSKSEDYASFNCQNVDPRVRGCFVPSPGYLLFSCDYSQMELGSLAQRCFQLFGYSVLRDKINAGVDVHAFTGDQLAYANDEEFRKLCIARGASTREQIFDLFLPLGRGREMDAKFYKHWRTFAKPVNLGYPGGLGPDTFRKLAKVVYDVIVTFEEAKAFRELWKQTYPEMVEYFAHINKNCIDPWNKGWDEKAKEEYDLYHYDSPFGMHRAGCDYCACANGLGLQTHSADGALAALISLIPACFTGKGSSILGPVDGKRVVRPWGFIHDEFIGEVLDDGQAHERMLEIQRIMEESMRLVTPDVTPRTHAALMRRWDKDADPVYDANGRLTVWEPKSAK